MKFCFVLVCLLTGVRAEIPFPHDAPQPMSPEETVASYDVPEGFRLELAASEPLIQSPSGVCWDAAGHLYVSELHGYNLEGQLDIESLNQTGKLDVEVRRVQAEDKFKKAALSDTYGVIKRLDDLDGDGRMDRATVFASGLPPAYGMVAARGGIIVACAPDIVFLADRDEDGKAEHREVLFTGFGLGPLERGINAPQWTRDGWIAFGRGADGGRISGPYLVKDVDLPRTDFRIRADGSAIEPITGGTHTFGFTYSSAGHRFVVSTTAPAIQVAPIDYRYLIRNPMAASSGLTHDITPDRRAYPRSEAHPWRKKRAEHADYFEYYRSRYGASDSDPSGWFTSGCSPFVYRDTVISALQGQLLACDPAQNFIFRGELNRSDDPKEIVYQLARHTNEQTKEFCASSDAWSHPMSLSHGPDGAVWIVDYYREIIEDYSAIPRHLQQQYGLYRGHDRGRIYRLTHEDANPLPNPDMTGKSTRELVDELTSPSSWRRETALRLLRESKSLAPKDAAPSLLQAELRHEQGTLENTSVLRMLDDSDPITRMHAARYAEPDLRKGDTALLDKVVELVSTEEDPWVLLQLALSLGESKSHRAVQSLLSLARKHGDIRWMTTAIHSSLYLREQIVMDGLKEDVGKGADLLGAIEQSGEKLAVSGAKTIVETASQPLDDATFGEFVKGLEQPRDPAHGAEVFQQHCAICHQIGGIGVNVGPDILGEIGVGEEALLRQILVPEERIRPGYETTVVTLNEDAGEMAGILKEDGATSLTLILPGGVEQVVLRQRVENTRHLTRSLMPPNYQNLLSPKDAADLLAWVQTAHRVTTPPTIDSSPKIGQRLSDAHVAQFAGLALKGIFKEYPNKPSNVIRDPDGVRSPREMHPVFYGCFDWHSSVHGHWMLVHLLRNYPGASVASEIESALEKQLLREPLLKETAYFEEKGNASFERMYGWAWALRLATELRTWDDPRAKRWAEAYRPLEDKIVALMKAYLPRLGWPIRTGVHPDTAFALGQSLDYARAVENNALERLILDRSKSFYASDERYPAAYEPSGEDFFSAGLNEADLMRRVLPQEEYVAWLDRFLPEFGNLFEPVEVTDVTDGKLVHLAGLNLSRGWTLNGIASALNASDPRQREIREAAVDHTQAGLGYVFSGHYEGDHWLATFAIYTLSLVGISR